jgi:hypothetical protein
MRAIAQDGVRPWKAQGSRVTNAERAAALPVYDSDAIEEASACGVPGAPVKPRETTSSFETMMQPTGGLGRHAGSAFRLSANAAAMNRTFASEEKCITPAPRQGLHHARASLALLAAPVFGFFKSVEQTSRVGSRECVQTVGLAFLDGIPRTSTLGPKEFGFILHFTVPHVPVELAYVHEHAHF